MYKKILSLFTAILIGLSAQASDLSAMCAQPYDLSMKGTQVLTNVTGMTFLSQAIANSIVKKELKKATGTKKGFKVKMKSYSAKDLANGRFKSLDINGKNLNMDGIYVSNFNASTICDFNYVKATPKSVKFKENFAMNYSMTLTNDDLRKTVLSDEYIKFLKSLNLKMGGLNLFELKNADVKMKDGKFIFSLAMNNTMFNYSIPLNLDVSAKMKIQNGKFQVSEVAWENINRKVSLTQITNLLNVINPLNFTVDILNNPSSKVALKTFDIKDNNLNIAGTIFIPKNTVESRK